MSKPRNAFPTATLSLRAFRLLNDARTKPRETSTVVPVVAMLRWRTFILDEPRKNPAKLVLPIDVLSLRVLELDNASSKLLAKSFTWQFLMITPVLLVSEMPEPEPVPAMVWPLQSRVMLLAPIISPEAGQGGLGLTTVSGPSSTLLNINVSPHAHGVNPPQLVANARAVSRATAVIPTRTKSFRIVVLLSCGTLQALYAAIKAMAQPLNRSETAGSCL